LMFRLLIPIKRLLSVVPSAELLPEPLKDFGYCCAPVEDQQLTPAMQWGGTRALCKGVSGYKWANSIVARWLV
jgi:hypothetical protein